jgi:peptidoglycan/LPS O-acetylase OafA/YrhL
MARVTRTRLEYVPALDGLRGVAILLVIGRHYFGTPLGGGTVGVELFFVLSGYLITSLLFQEHTDTGRISLTDFYRRRARRLLPALAVMLGAYLVGAAIQGRLAIAARAAAAGAFYTANVAQAYWPHLIGGEPIGPLWSLALEEQFYLLWPLALILLFRFGVSRRVIIVGLGSLIALICAERIWLLVEHASNQRIYASPESASDALLTGVLLAFILREPKIRDQRRVLIGIEIFAFTAFLGLVETFTGPLVDLSAALLITFAVQKGSWFSRALSWRPLVWVGLISYSLYLWHMLILSWLGENHLVALPVAFAVAYASTRWVERPFRRRRSVRVAATAGQPALATVASAGG